MGANHPGRSSKGRDDMTDNSYSVFNAMVDIVHASFDNPNAELASGLFVYYYSWVDFPWLVEETIRQVPAERRAESADAIRQFMEPGRSMWTTVIAIVIVSFIIYTIQASYLHKH